MQIADNDMIEEIKAHAEMSYPNECCGLVVAIGGKNTYLPCKNSHEKPADYFRIDPASYADAEDAGEIVMIVHSHPGEDAIPYPSEYDRVMMVETGLPWGIITWPFGEYVEHSAVGEQKLTGRDFSLGGNDCYGLVMAFHRDNGITLPDYRKPYPWWDRGEDIFNDENIKAAGFEEVKELTAGCVIIMKIAAKVPNHSGIYVGDGTVIHHMNNCKSIQENYMGSYMQGRTVKIVRHKSLPTEGIVWKI